MGSKNPKTLAANRYRKTPKGRQFMARANARRVLRARGMTEHGLVHLLIAQGGRCVFCARRRSSRNYRLIVDHDHITNRVRGLLCAVHNSALAAFGDGPEGLMRALRYVVEGRRL